MCRDMYDRTQSAECAVSKMPTIQTGPHQVPQILWVRSEVFNGVIPFPSCNGAPELTPQLVRRFAAALRADRHDRLVDYPSFL